MQKNHMFKFSFNPNRNMEKNKDFTLADLIIIIKISLLLLVMVGCGKDQPKKVEASDFLKKRDELTLINISSRDQQFELKWFSKYLQQNFVGSKDSITVIDTEKDIDTEFIEVLSNNIASVPSFLLSNKGTFLIEKEQDKEIIVKADSGKTKMEPNFINILNDTIPPLLLGNTFIARNYIDNLKKHIKNKSLDKEIEKVYNERLLFLIKKKSLLTESFYLFLKKYLEIERYYTFAFSIAFMDKNIQKEEIVQDYINQISKLINDGHYDDCLHLIKYQSLLDILVKQITKKEMKKSKNSDCMSSN